MTILDALRYAVRNSFKWPIIGKRKNKEATDYTFFGTYKKYRILLIDYSFCYEQAAKIWNKVYKTLLSQKYVPSASTTRINRQNTLFLYLAFYILYNICDITYKTYWQPVVSLPASIKMFIITWFALLEKVISATFFTLQVPFISLLKRQILLSGERFFALDYFGCHISLFSVYCGGYLPDLR